MGKFRNVKAERVGKPFTLPVSGISGNIHGLGALEIRDLLKGFLTTEEIQALQDGNFVLLLDRAPEEIAKILLGMMNEPQEKEDIEGLLSLELPDLKALTIAAMNATFDGKNPKDFFGGWAEGMALDGFFSNLASQPEESLSEMNSETSSNTPMPVDPETLALLTE